MSVKTQVILTDGTGSIGLGQATIECYFKTINAHDFQGAADLFGVEGVLNAPFEEPIVGRSAIAAYLSAEAKGMQLYPREAASQIVADANLEIHITGKVETPIFGVNVGWLFLLNPQLEIVSVTIKLLASPQELLKLRTAAKFEK